MQDFSNLQNLCELHKQTVNIINILENSLNQNDGEKNLSIIISSDAKVKIDLSSKDVSNQEYLVSLLSGYKQVEREISGKINNYLRH